MMCALFWLIASRAVLAARFFHPSGVGHDQHCPQALRAAEYPVPGSSRTEPVVSLGSKYPD